MRFLFVCLLPSGATVYGQSKATLTIDLQHPKGKVSATLYGLRKQPRGAWERGLLGNTCQAIYDI